MKFVCVVLGLALTLAGIGVACGPEEKYCYNEHMTCKDALIEKIAKDKEAAEIARQLAEALETSDGGATVIGQ